MDWQLLLLIVVFVLLVLLAWIFLRTARLNDFIRKLKSSTAEAAKSESFRPLETENSGEVNMIVNNVNEIYAALKNYNSLTQKSEEFQKENKKLQEQLITFKSAVDYLNVISELGQKISSSLSLREVIRNLSSSIGSMMNASNVEIQLNFKVDGNVNEFANKENDKIYSTEFAKWCLTNGKNIFLEDVEKNYVRYLYKLPFDLNDKIPQSLICCPMMSENKTTGVISVLSFRKNAFSTYHFEMIKSLVPYATLAIENAKGYEDLKAAQLQLVQQEKMASLGQLTAGVAHEINNPINFVSANVKPLKRDIDDILSLLEKFNSLDQNNFQSQIDGINKFKSQIDLDYTITEIKSLINGIEEGSRRTAEIVKGLRNFSRFDEEEMKKANINEGIESTLVLLQHKLHQNKIEVVTSLGDLPEIECYPGQLNQVFMNLISNAIDAIDKNGKISITTSKENALIKISIRDTGKGMSDDVKKKIFDPFFTTKDVGKGTGLGLSISYGIIEKHNGKIEVNSEVERGTEFIVSLALSKKSI